MWVVEKFDGGCKEKIGEYRGSCRKCDEGCKEKIGEYRGSCRKYDGGCKEKIGDEVLMEVVENMMGAVIKDWR
jgi:uncharacterized protein YjbJ (UPF0337 family)